MSKFIVKFVEKKGGAGSGHHGHAGRPGKRGGSLPGKSGVSISARNSDEEAMLQHVTAEAKLRSSHIRGTSFPEHLLNHARFFNPPSDDSELPEWCVQGEMKQCYLNSITGLMGAPDDVYYTEGYAFVDGLTGFPIQHGWLTTSNGDVIDPTWRDNKGVVYYGIRYNRDYVMDVVYETEMAGILVNDYLTGSKIAKLGFPAGALVDESTD